MWEAAGDPQSPEGFCWFKAAAEPSCKRYGSGGASRLGFAGMLFGSRCAHGRSDGC